MADIDMDVDTTGAPALDTHIDEDLIDYEDDFANMDDDVISMDHQSAPTVPDGNEPDEVIDTVLGDADFHEEQDQDGMETAYNMEEPHESLSGNMEDQADPGVEPVEEVDYLAQTEGDVTHNTEEPAAAAAAEPEAPVQENVQEAEISYEEEEQTQDADPEKLDPVEGDQETHPVNDDNQIAEEHDANAEQPGQERETHADFTEVETKGVDEPENPEPTQHPANEEDEITWEDGNAKEGLDGAEEESYVVGDDGANHEEEDGHDENDGEKQEEPEVSAPVETEHHPSTADRTPAKSDGTEFPAITVQYKGEEFPLFSHTSEGFFSEVSVLDDSIETLLSGFRAELVNEIAADEELVYQVDELGLEYAESFSRDSLSHVTLRQILEIFDLLVKNQDPDSSRTLYTYLFTKPSTTKRFDFLVESAAAGKGLDEVIHLYESPMLHSTHVEEAAHDDELGLDLDEYESAGDSAGDDTSLQGPPEHAANAEEGAAHDYSESQDDPSAAQDEPEHESAEATEQHLDLEAHEDDQQGKPEEYAYAGDDLGGAAASEVAAAAQDGEPEAALDAEANHDEHDEVQLDLDEGLLGATGEGQDAIADSTVTSTTTNTVKNEDSVAADAPADEGLDLLEHVDETNGEGVTTQEEHGDDFAEIDWRDEEAAGDEVTSNTPGSAQKRAHADDELDAADGKDVKRQRS